MNVRRERIIDRARKRKEPWWMMVLLLFVLGHEVFSKEWKGIVPCVSTRFKAEKILGSHESPLNLNIYKYKNSRVHIEYRENENDPNKDIVEQIDVYPDKSELLSKYIKKIPNFQKDFLKTELDKTNHLNWRAVYRNWTEGFEIWVQRNEENAEVIERFGYFDRTYSCSKILPER